MESGGTLKALITGITGQDGSYLAELLLSKGYEVHGLVRRASHFNTHRIDHLYQDIHEPHPLLHLHFVDLTEDLRIIDLLNVIQPNEIYNLAAQSHVRVSFDQPLYTSEVTGLGVARFLEAIRVLGLETKFYQASSSEMFGATPPPQSESSMFYPRSPYGVAKLYGYWMTRNYREAHDLFAVNGILFNHESPRRGETFVTRKISRAVARISVGLQKELYLGNISAERDWGYAPEYVEAMWLMLQAKDPEDYVIATGQVCSVRDFAEAAFKSVNLNWEHYVKYDSIYERPTEVDALIGNPRKALNNLNWSHKIEAKQLAEIMVKSDLSLLDNPGQNVPDPFIFSKG
jgi:GDPmannose 4,6-dehydratase